MTSTQNFSQDFLLEIFTEELPHGSLDPEEGECCRIAEALEKKFTSLQIPFNGKTFFLTPRRIAIIFHDMVGILPIQEKVTQGPPLSLCFKSGKPSPALNGFIKNFPSDSVFLNDENIKSVESIPVFLEKEDSPPGLYRRTINKTEFVIHYRCFPKRKITSILLNAIPEVLEKITFTKSMYWGNKQGPFLRPIRSLLALWGKEVIPFTFFGLTAGRHTWGHRFLSSGQISISEASLYQEILYREKVIVDPKERLQVILKGVEEIEKSKRVKALNKSKVASIVSRLTEYPIPVYAEVDPQLIKIPREVVVSEMVEHQMYFPVENNGKLTSGFILTTNGIHTSEVIAGNRNVLSSRLNDGIFLFQEDIKAGLEKLSRKMERILFEKTLGSYGEKCSRIAQLALLVQKQAGDFFSGIDDKTITVLSRLIKYDLASGMVYEFPHLQGIMGKYYAEQLRDVSFHGVKLDQEIANAIREHYLPLSSQGEMPSSRLAVLMSIADKLDNLLGLFAVKLIPTGNNDPYALRRQGYGIIRLLTENQIMVSLDTVLEKGAMIYKDFRQDDWVKDVSQFLEKRFKTYAKDCGFTSDESEAVSLDMNPYDRHLKMKVLHQERSTPEFINLLAGLKRIINITEKNSSQETVSYTINKETIEKHLHENAEKNLLKTHLEIKSRRPSLTQLQNYSELIRLYYRYPTALELFFNDIMVNVEEKELRHVRLSLLREIKNEINGFSNIDKIKMTDK